MISFFRAAKAKKNVAVVRNTRLSVAWLNPKSSDAGNLFSDEENEDISRAYLFVTSNQDVDENWMPSVLTEEEQEKLFYNEYY